MRKFLLGCIFVFQINFFVNAHFRNCLTPLGDAGKCVSLKNCPEILLLYRNLPPNQATEYAKILKNICGNQVTFDEYPLVCCRNPNYGQGQQMDYGLIWIENPGGITEPPITTTTTKESSIPTETSKIQADKEPKKPCLDSGNEIGFCQPLESCAELYGAILSNPTNETVKDNLRYAHRTCDSIGTDVCCPMATKKQNTNTRNVGIFPPTEDDGCGRDHHIFQKKVIDGQESEVGAWPWIALLGYNPYSSNPFRCGGTLITSRHVLTAAHCILPDLSFVRLGEHDITIEDDTTYIDVDIAKAIRHEDYSKVQMRFDIALVVLVRSVDFTDTIYPVCLPMSNEMRRKSFVSYTPFAAGWGRISTENSTTSDVLREVQLFVHENQVCQDAFALVLRAKGRRLSNRNFDDSVLCVGDLAGKKDTCRGDSGGPLMVPESYKGVQKYYLIGITSYGIGCARPGVPSIYTSTQYFMDWILQNIQET